MIEKIIFIGYRIFSSLAILLVLLAAWEWLINLFGYGMSWLPYTAGRLLVFAVICLLFAVAALVREIRNSLAK